MVVTLTVEDVMHTDVVTVAPDAGAGEAAALLEERDVGSVVVVEDDEPVGIVTEDDVVALFVGGDAPETPVAEFMSQPVVTVRPAAGLDEAAATMSEEGFTNLPVRDDSGALVGLVSRLGLSYYFPVVAHPPTGPDSLTQRRRESRPDTAYESDEWEFESLGTSDGEIQVGDSVTFSKTIDDEDVAAFAEASGDTNRLHLDAEYAAGTRFGRPIVHGTLVAGTISAALARLPGLTIYLSQEVTYRGPVDVGEFVTAHCEVAESLGDDRYRLTTEVLGEDDEVVVEGDAVVVSDPIPETA